MVKLFIQLLIQAYEKINKNKYIPYFTIQSTKKPISCKNDNKPATKKYIEFHIHRSVETKTIC